MSMLTEQTKKLRVMSDFMFGQGDMFLGCELREAADTIDNLRRTCNDLQVENEKLKALVRDMKHHVCRMHADDPCDAVCAAYDSGLRMCSYVLRMRELGIEVDG